MTPHSRPFGCPYRPPHGVGVPAPAAWPTLPPSFVSMDWPQLWKEVYRILIRQCGFQRSTLAVYRQILRQLKASLEARHPDIGRLPSRIQASHLVAFLQERVDGHASASWLSLNLAVVRTVFDKLTGRELTAHIEGPKRPWKQPEWLSSSQIAQLIEVCPTPRDRLIIGLLYGCGLKVGELTRLCWGDIDLTGEILTLKDRQLPLPKTLIPILDLGCRECGREERILAGRKAGAGLSARQVERVIRAAGKRAGIAKEVSCSTLRHSYAMAALLSGNDIAMVKEALGLRHIESMLTYERMRNSVRAIRSAPDLTAGMTMETQTEPSSPVEVDVKIDLSEAVLPFPDTSSPVGQFLTICRTRLRDGFLRLRSRSGP